MGKKASQGGSKMIAARIDLEFSPLLLTGSDFLLHWLWYLQELCLDNGEESCPRRMKIIAAKSDLEFSPLLLTGSDFILPWLWYLKELCFNNGEESCPRGVEDDRCQN